MLFEVLLSLLEKVAIPCDRYLSPCVVYICGCSASSWDLLWLSSIWSFVKDTLFHIHLTVLHVMLEWGVSAMNSILYSILFVFECCFTKSSWCESISLNTKCRRVDRGFLDAKRKYWCICDQCPSKLLITTFKRRKKIFNESELFTKVSPPYNHRRCRILNKPSDQFSLLMQAIL
jgi:hypothetical protein